MSSSLVVLSHRFTLPISPMIFSSELARSLLLSAFAADFAAVFDPGPLPSDPYVVDPAGSGHRPPSSRPRRQMLQA
eukprot:12903132-Prorocentrum_lima.AAC.1